MNILHLSDLHISNKTNSEDLAAKIHNASIENRVNIYPDSIVVTGDIFDSKDFASDEYAAVIDKAINFFNQLSSHFLINDLCEYLLFVPGNHEINRESIKNGKEDEKFNRYCEFLNKLYDTKWDELKNSVYNERELCFVKHFKNKKTILIGLNSPRYEKSNNTKTSEEYIETARIGHTQINILHGLIKNISDYDSNRVIVCLHNNIYNTIERTITENVDSTCVQDNDSLLSVLNNYKCNLILHGHKHQLKNRRINLTQNIKEKDNICTIISGGTLKGLSSDSFNYIEIFDENNKIDLTCKEFCDESGRFRLSEQFSIPVQEDKRLFSKVEDALQCDSQLYVEYEKLKDADTSYDKKLLNILDSTLCAFKEISDNFFLNPSVSSNFLYVILGAMHFRSNFLNNGSFLEQSKEFLLKATDKIGLSDSVLKMLNTDDVWLLFDIYEGCKNNIHSIEYKKVLIFLVLTIYLSDFYLTIKFNPDKFYKKYIQQKANYNLENVDIKTVINGNTIGFDINEEHRALEITVRCATANSHKIISLIIKEFELILSKFEEDFASVGFRVYYVLPKLMKPDINNEKLESYEFAAYIPKLIPLLAGKNIYTKPEAFTRELIQNSIDAIKVLSKRTENNNILNNAKIKLEIKEDTDSGLKYFRISDEGTGMNRYVLERYLTTIGRSFYTGNDFQNLGIKYSPISQFGIGFLSCFMLGKHVEVCTTHFENLNETFYLDIPNYDGCFFIEPKRENIISSGSTITVWENEEYRNIPDSNFNIENIKKYINDIICNIPFDITLNSELFISKYNYFSYLKDCTKENNLLFFIPIASDPDEDGCTIIDQTLNEHIEHGIYLYKKDKALYSDHNYTVMNNGILVGESSIIDKTSREIHPYLDIAFNFPSHALELEVSRDKLKHLKRISLTPIKKYLKKQIKTYFKSDIAKTLNYFMWCLLDNKSYNLSDINLNFSNNSFNINIENHNSIDELNKLYNFIKKFDKITKDQKFNIPSGRLNFIRDFDSRLYRYRDFDEYDNLFNSSSIKHTLKDEDIIDIIDKYQNKYLFHNFFDNQKYWRRFEELFSRYGFLKHENNNILKWLVALLFQSYNEKHTRGNPKEFPEKMRYLFRDIKDLDFYTCVRSINILSTLKFIISNNYSYNELKEGISIPIDLNSILNIKEK
jgi:hypothetical protein